MAHTDIAAIEAAFKDLDIGRKGSIGEDEILQSLKRLNPNATRANVKKFLRYFDEDNTGTISFDEIFVSEETQKKLLHRRKSLKEVNETSSGGSHHARHSRHKDSDSDSQMNSPRVSRKPHKRISREPSFATNDGGTEVLRAFNAIDIDHSGEISTEEILTTLKKLDANVNEATVQEFLDAFDKDRNGRVTFDEFREGVIKYNIDPKIFIAVQESWESSASSNRRSVSRSSSGVLDDIEIDWGDLEMKEMLGEGTFGVVQKAKWRGVDVAVKSLKGLKVNSLDDEGNEILEEFKKELLILSKLRHPNTVLLLGQCTTPNHLAMVTEFVPGGNLFELLHKKKVQLTQPQMVKIANGIAFGMNYLHLCKPPIVHRDLKSLNILLDENLRPKIADFGLSRVRNTQDTVMTAKIGSPLWMAPELIKNEDYDEKVDVYSYAIVLFEVVSGKLPYPNMDAMQIAMAVGYHGKRPQIPDSCHPVLAQVMEQCWNEDKRRRPSFKEIIATLETIT